MAFGRFPRSAVAQPMSEINVTPLVDVMLVLVVIFILTAPLLAGSLRLQLPKAQGASFGPSAAGVALELDRSGRLHLGGVPIEEAQLAQRLAALARDRPDTEIQLRADAAVPYGRVAQLMGAAQAAGLSRIAFVAEPTALGAATAH